MNHELQSERGKMKKRLWDWGQTLERCAWKQEELKRLMDLREIQRQMWKGKQTKRAQQNLRRVEKEYEEEVKRIRLELEAILQEKEKIDRVLEQLTSDEKEFTYLRFEKGYGFDYIGLKMHLSRATLFRMQDRILKKMIESES